MADDEALAETFSTLDSNGDRLLDCEEVGELLRTTFPEKDPEEITTLVGKVMMKADTNKDGVITLNEYIDSVRRGDGVLPAEVVVVGSSPTMHELQNKLSPAEILFLHYCFATIDINGDGQISADELQQAISKELQSHPNITPEVVDSLVKETIACTDMDKNGQISLTEFASAFAKGYPIMSLAYLNSIFSNVVRPLSSREILTLQRTFRQYDIDCDGQLNGSELYTLFQRCCDCDDEEIRRLCEMALQVSDTNRDQKLSLVEFIQSFAEAHGVLPEIIPFKNTDVEQPKSVGVFLTNRQWFFLKSALRSLPPKSSLQTIIDFIPTIELGLDNFHHNTLIQVISSHGEDGVDVEKLLQELTNKNNIQTPRPIPSSVLGLRRELVLAFAKLDANGDGFLDSSEIHPVVCKLAVDRLGVDPIEAATIADELLLKADCNKDGLISISEFIASFDSPDGVTLLPYDFAQRLAAVSKLPGNVSEELVAHMNQLRQNKKNTEYLLSEDELRQMLSDCLKDTATPVEEILSVFLDADQNAQSRKEGLYSVSAFLHFFGLSKELDEWISVRQDAESTATFHHKLNHIISNNDYLQATVSIFNPVSELPDIPVAEYLEKNLPSEIEPGLQKEIISMITDVFGYDGDIHNTAKRFYHVYSTSKDAENARETPEARLPAEEILDAYFTVWFDEGANHLPANMSKNSLLYIRALHCFDDQDPVQDEEAINFLQRIVELEFPDCDSGTKQSVIRFILSTAGYAEPDEIRGVLAADVVSQFKVKLEIVEDPCSELKNICQTDGVYRTVLHTLAGDSIPHTEIDESIVAFLQRTLAKCVPDGLLETLTSTVINCVDHADSLNLASDFLPVCQKVFFRGIMSDIAMHQSELLDLCEGSRQLYYRICNAFIDFSATENSSDIVECIDSVLMPLVPQIDVRQQMLALVLHAIRYDEQLSFADVIVRFSFMYVQTGIPNPDKNRQRIKDVLRRMVRDFDEHFDSVMHMFDYLDTRESTPSNPIALIDNLLSGFLDNPTVRKEVMKQVFLITDSPDGFESFHQYVTTFRDAFDVQPHLILPSKKQRILGESDYRAIMHVFDCLDANRDGYLDRSEISGVITQILSKVKPPLKKSHSEISKIIKTVIDTHDLDHDGQISLKEFVQSFQKSCGSVVPIDFVRKERHLAKRLTKEEILGLKNTFADLDTNSDGILDRQELVAAISSVVGIERATEIADDLIPEGSNGISKTDFFRHYAKDEGIGAMVPYLYTQRIADAEVLLSFVISSLSVDQQRHIIANQEQTWTAHDIVNLLRVDEESITDPDSFFNKFVSFSDRGIDNSNGTYEFRDLSKQLKKELVSAVCFQKLDDAIPGGVDAFLETANGYKKKNGKETITRDDVASIVSQLSLCDSAINEVVLMIVDFCEEVAAENNLDIGRLQIAKDIYHPYQKLPPVDCQPSASERTTISVQSLTVDEISILCRALGPISDPISPNDIAKKVLQITDTRRSASLVAYLHGLVPNAVDPFAFMASVQVLLSRKKPSALSDILCNFIPYPELPKVVSGLQTIDNSSISEFVSKLFQEDPYFVTSILTSQDLSVLLPELENALSSLNELRVSTAVKISTLITNKDLCLLVSGLQAISNPADIPSMTAKVIPGHEEATALLMKCCAKIDTASLSAELHKVQREKLASWERHAERIAKSMTGKELSFVIAALRQNDSSHPSVHGLATDISSRITLCVELEKFSTESGFIHMVEDCAASLRDLLPQHKIVTLLRTCPKANVTKELLEKIEVLEGNSAAINIISCCIDSRRSLDRLWSILSLPRNSSEPASMSDLHLVSDDVSGSLYSEGALAQSYQLFEKMSGNGTLTKTQFRKLYLSLEWCGLEPSDRDIENIFKSTSSGDTMTFDDYCIAMLKRAKM